MKSMWKKIFVSVSLAVLLPSTTMAWADDWSSTSSSSPSSSSSNSSSSPSSSSSSFDGDRNYGLYGLGFGLSKSSAEDHGYFTGTLHVDYIGEGQSFTAQIASQAGPDLFRGDLEASGLRIALAGENKDNTASLDLFINGHATAGVAGEGLLTGTLTLGAFYPFSFGENHRVRCGVSGGAGFGGTVGTNNLNNATDSSSSPIASANIPPLSFSAGAYCGDGKLKINLLNADLILNQLKYLSGSTNTVDSTGTLQTGVWYQLNKNMAVGASALVDFTDDAGKYSILPITQVSFGGTFGGDGQSDHASSNSAN